MEKELLKLEFRVPISPNDKYMRMMQYFMASLHEFAGPIGRAAHCVASVGADEPPRDLSAEYPWVDDYSIEFQWVDRELFCKDSYEATGYHRMGIKSDADIVALVDADLLFTGDFDKVIIQSYVEQSMLGFIAHVSPFHSPEDIMCVPSRTWWSRVFEQAGLDLPDEEWEHTGWSLMSTSPEHRYSPVYFNYGVIVAPRMHFEVMNDTFVEDVGHVDAVLETWFKSQLANTLSIIRHSIPYNVLPINYNFPLHVSGTQIRELNPDPDGENCVEDIKIFHYLGDGEVNKEDFLTEGSLQKLLESDELSESGKCFQRKLKVIHEKLSRIDSLS